MVVDGASGSGGKRFGLGNMETGERAPRPPQCQSRDAGVTSGYMWRVSHPGILPNGATVVGGGAEQIRSSRLNRVGRLHIQPGGVVNQLPFGIRRGSEVALAVGGARCASDCEV